MILECRMIVDALIWHIALVSLSARSFLTTPLCPSTQMTLTYGPGSHLVNDPEMVIGSTFVPKQHSAMILVGRRSL